MTKWIAAIIVTLGGCATPAPGLRVTYLSDPPGAMLYQGGQSMGYTPRTLFYPLAQWSEKTKTSGRLALVKTRVQWASGASAEVQSMVADIKLSGLNQQFTFQRPSVPGREADVQFALELRRLQLMERQAKAQEDQAAAQMFNAINQSWSTQQQSCSSTIIGNIVNTSCY